MKDQGRAANTTWPTVRLAEVAEQCLGKMLDAKKNKGRHLPYLRNPNVRWFEVDTTDLQTMPFEEDEDERYGLRAGDIVICEGGEAGRAAIWDGRMPNVKFQKAIHRIRSGPKLHNRYFVHRLMADYYSGRLADYYTGATIKHLTGQDLARYEFPLPPIVDQRRIAEILDKADALRAKRRAALAQLDRLAQSIFLDMFGDPRHEQMRWPIVPFERIVRETKLGLVRGSQEFGPDFPVPYIRMNAITRNGELELEGVQRTHATVREIEAYRLEPGDLLFNTRNSEELVGKTALYRGGGPHLFNNNLMRIRFTANADPEFVAVAFRMPFARNELSLRKSGTTNVFAIYYKELRSLPLPLPPIALQREFAGRVATIEGTKSAQRAFLADLNALFASLQHRAFRGEL